MARAPRTKLSTVLFMHHSYYYKLLWKFPSILILNYEKDGNMAVVVDAKTAALLIDNFLCTKVCTLGEAQTYLLNVQANNDSAIIVGIIALLKALEQASGIRSVI